MGFKDWAVSGGLLAPAAVGMVQWTVVSVLTPPATLSNVHSRAFYLQVLRRGGLAGGLACLGAGP